MARINIEDSLFKDARFLDLCIMFGDKQKALGAIVWVFIIAQKHFLDESNDRLIPLSDWKQQGCSDKLIELGFAEIKDKGVYICGSEKQFAWLVQRVEAGRKGGLGGRHIYENMTDEDRKLREIARKAVANAVQRKRLIKPEVCEGCGVSCLPEAHHSDYSKPFEITWVCKKCHHEIHDKLLGLKDKGLRATGVKRDEAVAKPPYSLLLTPTLYSNSNSNSNSNNMKKKLETAPTRVVAPDEYSAAKLIALYCDNWKFVYKSSLNPMIDGKCAKLLKNFLKHFGKEKSELVINTYFKMPDKWFLTKKHDIPTMLSSTNSIIHFIETGRVVTQKDLNEIEKNVTSQNTLDALRNGEI